MSRIEAGAHLCREKKLARISRMNNSKELWLYSFCLFVLNVQYTDSLRQHFRPNEVWRRQMPLQVGL